MIGIGFFLAALATTGNNVGKGLQKLGTVGLPPLALRWAVLRAYLRSPAFAAGFAADLIGGLLTVPALAFAPVSVVQPVLTSGMALLVLFSHRYLAERLALKEWAGVLLSVLGSVGIGATLAEAAGHLDFLAGIATLGVGVLLLAALGLGSRRRQGAEIPAGIQAGLCFGLSAAIMRAGLLATQVSGHLYLVGVGLAGAALFTTTGFFFQTRGFRQGRAVVVGTWAGVVALASAVIAGTVALGEPLPPSAARRILRVTSFAVIALGAVLMAGQADGCDSQG